jgi:glutamyl-tRNA synthetase
MIHGPDGQKLSKRHGAVSVMQYDEDGYLPEAVVNYLARLGWSHGDEEVFSREQFVRWFDGTHISRSPSRFDFDKLRWLNHHYLKASDDAALAERVLPRLLASGSEPAPGLADLAAVCGLLKERAQTLNELAELARMFYAPAEIPAADREKYFDAAPPALTLALAALAARLTDGAWTKEAISAALKDTLAEHGLKMAQLAMPVRLKVFGTTQTPSLDAMLATMSREHVIARLRA